MGLKLVEGGNLGDWFGYKSAGRYFATNEEIYALRKVNPNHRCTTKLPYIKRGGRLIHI